MLKIYVFNFQDKRIKARAEYNNKNTTINMTYRETYEVKNVMVFLIAMDSKNE